MNSKPVKTKPRMLLPLAFLSLLILLPAGAVHAAALRIMYTNDVLGELDGCG